MEHCDCRYDPCGDGCEICDPGTMRAPDAIAELRTKTQGKCDAFYHVSLGFSLEVLAAYDALHAENARLQKRCEEAEEMARFYGDLKNYEFLIDNKDNWQVIIIKENGNRARAYLERVGEK
ncbi:hypothetical protein [Rhodopila sp.]|uniref:hypothetical protein n=1 Tax=Rhodopila sp. TaxID=2480087 RepID=UPI003D0EDA2C